MALSVTDVKNIVNGQVGGMPLTPATTTIVEGRVVTPQVASVCSIGSKASEFFTEIDNMLKDFMAGLDSMVINPIKEFVADAKAAITAATAYISGILATLEATVQAATALASAAIASAFTALGEIFAHVENLIKDGLNQVLAALSFCSPTESVPSAKKYAADDFTFSMKQQASIDNIKLQASSIAGILGDSALTDAQKVTQLNAVTAAVNGNKTTVTNAVTSDQNNLATAQKQNEGLGKVTTLANALNNPDTKAFTQSIINPAKASTFSGLAGVMKI